ncbi:MAG TPA: AI-2E family transporter [Ilumatobacteraceae bacterium]|nr:AI-2E family transporter [Ilumatobacteraceae bacterium]
MGIPRKVQKLSGSSEHEGLFLPSHVAPGLTDPGDVPSRPRQTSWADVPWRTIIASVGVVVVTYGLLMLLLAATRILTWVLIAGFMAIVLAPLVSRLDRRLGGRRNIATATVVIGTLVVSFGAIALFVMPVRTQLVDIITDLPGTVHQAADGRGPVGNLVQRLHVENYIKNNEDKLASAADRLSGSSFEVVKSVASAAFAFVTIILLTFLFLSQSAAIANAAKNLLPHRRRPSAERIAADAASAVSGYVIGNFIISAIAGTAAFVCLVALGVPSPVVLALWVAFADLIPLVGATLGAAVCVIAAYVHSPTAGIITLVFFIVYQQIENGVLYPWIMARKVKVNPLVILLSVLLAVEVFGLIGALLAVPVSGALQVVVIAIRQEHQREQLVLPDNFDAGVDLTGHGD